MSVSSELLVILALILLNGFFAAAEIAILTARRSRLEPRAAAGDRAARRALKLADNPDRFLPAVQVGVTLVSTLGSVFGGAWLVRYLSEGLARFDYPPLSEHAASLAFGLVVIGITFFSLILGELVPKHLALLNPERLARLVAGPITLLAWIAHPVIWVTAGATGLVLALLRRRSAAPKVSLEDIEHLIRTGTRDGAVDPAEQRVARKALRLGERTVREIMRPRIEIDALDLDTPGDEVAGAVAMAGFSRVPVYEGDLDRIVGFVYAMDLLRQQHLRQPIELRKLIRPVFFVPETLPLDALLDSLRERHTQMAIVLDEYGGTEGLVTLEDVLEDLVGEVRDERDKPHTDAIVRRDQGSWSVDARLNLEDLLDAIGVAYDRAALPRDVKTAGGLVMFLLSRVPAIGDHVEWCGVRLEVVDMDGRRIDRLLVEWAPPRE